MRISLPVLDSNLSEAAARLCASKGVEPDAWLTRKQTAGMLGLSPKTLAKKASLRAGPPYTVLSRTRYRAIDAAMWFLRQARDPRDSAYAAAVQRRRERGDRIGRPPRAQLPITA